MELRREPHAAPRLPCARGQTAGAQSSGVHGVTDLRRGQGAFTPDGLTHRPLMEPERKGMGLSCAP